MDFDLAHARALLARTPDTLCSLLADLPDDWVRRKEAPDAWSPFDVVGHLIQGDLLDWIPRARFILEHGTMGQLLATWVVHDLGHIAQVARALAARHVDDVGPWRAYLRIINPDAV